MGCGLANAFFDHFEKLGKDLMLRRMSTSIDTHHSEPYSECATEDVRRTRSTQTPLDSKNSASVGSDSSPGLSVPSWLPVLKDMDEEYEDFVRRREVTLAALEEEQARIAALLSEMELARANVRSHSESDVGDSDRPRRRLS